MIISLIMTKDKSNALKTVILKKAIKKGTILFKMLTFRESTEVKNTQDKFEKCVITNSLYTRIRIPQKLDFLNMNAILIGHCIDIKVVRGNDYDENLISSMLEVHMKALERPDAEAYQMNLIQNGEK